MSFNEPTDQAAVVEHGLIRVTRTVPSEPVVTTAPQHRATATARGVGAMLYGFLDTVTGATFLIAVLLGAIVLADFHARGIIP